MPTQEIQAKMDAIKKVAYDPRLMLEYAKMQKIDPKDKQIAAMNEKLAALKFDPTKKVEYDQTRFTIAMQMLEAKQTNDFLGDVRTWRVTDPVLLKAVNDSAAKTGKADVANVLAAYLGDSTDQERMIRIATFKNAIRLAGTKMEGSMFGAPNWRQAEVLAIQKIGEFNKLKNAGAHVNSDNLYGTLRKGQAHWQTEMTDAANNVMNFFKPKGE